MRKENKCSLHFQNFSLTLWNKTIKNWRPSFPVPSQSAHILRAFGWFHLTDNYTVLTYHIWHKCKLHCWPCTGWERTRVCTSGHVRLRQRVKESVKASIQSFVLWYSLTCTFLCSLQRLWTIRVEKYWHLVVWHPGSGMDYLLQQM